MMSFYKDYVEELSKDVVLETDRGFIHYQINDDHIYIKELYVVPEFRKLRVASQFVDQVVSIAKDLGFKKIFGAVKPSVKASTDSAKAQLAYGFVLDSCVNDFILFRKDIE